ncbi:MAG: hypothetical protein KF814_07495 [Nitrospiraceae bacterium]|nr:hypothetical protein [Nitrospiraceae bacterium]
MFLVQKHHASRLHYDFRLEIDGVLKSWAIPKGPSMDPRGKRLAVQVEDHELSYADFEGVIEEGQYGAGPVLVWDRGWFEPVTGVMLGVSAGQMLEAGEIAFHLHGRRLEGKFTLVEMKGKPGEWLLIKRRDAAARPGSDVTAEYQESVLTGRTIEEIAEAAAIGLWAPRGRC